MKRSHELKEDCIKEMEPLNYEIGRLVDESNRGDVPFNIETLRVRGAANGMAEPALVSWTV